MTCITCYVCYYYRWYGAVCLGVFATTVSQSRCPVVCRFKWAQWTRRLDSPMDRDTLQGTSTISDSSHTWPAAPSMSVVVWPDRPLFSWYVVFHRAQCLGQFCSSCTQLTWFHSSSSTAYRRTCTLMTLRFMVQVVHLMSAPCCRRLPDVWQLLQIGCRPIGSNWIPTRQSSCGLPLLAVSTDYLPPVLW